MKITCHRQPSHSLSIYEVRSTGEVIFAWTILGYLANSTKLRLSPSSSIFSHSFTFGLHTTDAWLSFTVLGRAFISPTLSTFLEISTDALFYPLSTFLETLHRRFVLFAIHIPRSEYRLYRKFRHLLHQRSERHQLGLSSLNDVRPPGRSEKRREGEVEKGTQLRWQQDLQRDGGGSSHSWGTTTYS
jgi:hypothetical protein